MSKINNFNCLPSFQNINEKIKFSFLRLSSAVFLFALYINAPALGTLPPSLTLGNIDGVNIPFQNGFPVPDFAKQNRDIVNLAGVWRKERQTLNHDYTLTDRSSSYEDIKRESGERYLPGYDDSQWGTINIPGVENQMVGLPQPEVYEGGVWYRRHFTIPSQTQPKFYKLIFYSVNYVCDVWLNGIYLGYHEGGVYSICF